MLWFAGKLCMVQNEEVTYELLVYSGTRWEAQNTYGAKEQRTAVADAKQLAKVSTVQGGKVVKEFFDGKSNTSRSLTVYEHSQKQPEIKGRDQKTRKSSKASMIGDARVGGEEASSKGPSLIGTVVKILISIMFALAAAMVVTQMASFALRGVHSVGLLGKGDFLVFVFILVFAITALALITRILINLKRLGPFIKSRPAAPAPAQPKRRRRNPELTPSAVSRRSEKQVQEDEQKKAEEEAKKAEEEARRAEEEAQKQAELEAQRKAEEDAQSEIITMNAFAKDALEVLEGDKDKQDAHTVFGLVLFLVGAVQALRHHHKLSDPVANTVTARVLGNLGLSPERAKDFVAHTDEYLIANPRYSQMFQDGRGAMGEYLEYGTGPRGVLADSLNEWDKPKSNRENVSQPVTVLFTDIAGSTAMTQKLGDAGAQEVVRAHNRIVRDAIQSFAGKEIKHTGDGIMASFPSAVQGVEAAIDMQEQTKSHNAADPSHPLGLKIGLNAGEPISEENDLFGTTVQLAARIVDKATAGQVLVSGSVHGLSQGKNLKFGRFADLDMKGFGEPITVYKALWDPDETPVSQADSQPAQQPGPKTLVVQPEDTAPKAPAPETSVLEKPTEAKPVSEDGAGPQEHAHENTTAKTPQSTKAPLPETESEPEPVSTPSDATKPEETAKTPEAAEPEQTGETSLSAPDQNHDKNRDKE